jgi:hypothetical protein
MICEIQLLTDASGVEAATTENIPVRDHRTVNANEVTAFIAVNRNGTVFQFSML